MAREDEAWLPKTREDWVGMIADGFTMDRQRKEEADAKRTAEEGEKNDKTGKDAGPNDNGTKRTLAERILGGL